MWHLIKSYLRFMWNSTNQHGVHSPFVFGLVTKCFYDRTKYPEYQILKEYRKSLFENQKEIRVSDFGAGSRFFKSDRRKIGAIAKNAGISQKRAELLFRLVRYFMPDKILEIGTSVGLGTSALHLGNKDSEIITLEGCPNTLKVAQDHASDYKFHNINFVVGDFATSLDNLSSEKYQMVYFDGNHTKAATLQYFDVMLPTIAEDSVWIFDDIHWSVEMTECWKLIMKNPQVTVTIDTYQWGLVFFRSTQQKEHFTIRV